MSALTDLAEHVSKATVEYRKGEEVAQKDVGNLHVTEVYAMPPTPDRGVLVDVHFINVGFTEAVDKDYFIATLKQALGLGEFATITLNDLMGGLSYIALGGWIGSQDLALRMMALGEFYELWKVVTPRTLLGPDADQAFIDELAGGGLVMVAPKRETKELLS